MFSTKISRTATCAIVAPGPGSATAGHRTTACLAHRTRSSHQRRASSSKPSCPSDNNTGGSKPAPSSKTPDAGDDKTPPLDPTPHQRLAKRVSRPKRSKTLAAGDKLEDHFAGLPAVPGTQHLSQSDLSVSSFFSLHRPLSLKHPVPPISSQQAFNSIFEGRAAADPWANGNSAEGRPEDVVYALGSLFDGLQQDAKDSQSDNVQWEIIQESTSNRDAVRHLDGPPRQKTMEELVSEFRPFNAPPPPEPFHEASQAHSRRQVTKVKSKSYETTIIVTETTAIDGSRRWTAASSPMVRVLSPEDLADLDETSSDGQSSNLSHRARRLERSRAFWLRQKAKMQDLPREKHKMFLISVKRQRKLKMKKHKYKKLMKRTRNLRRRQDRA